MELSNQADVGNFACRRRGDEARTERGLQPASTDGWRKALEFFKRAGVREVKRRERRAPFHLPRLVRKKFSSRAKAAGGVVLPVGEILEVIFADCFHKIFAGVGSQTFPRAQGFQIHQPEQNLTVETRRRGENPKGIPLFSPKLMRHRLCGQVETSSLPPFS